MTSDKLAKVQNAAILPILTLLESTAIGFDIQYLDLPELFKL